MNNKILNLILIFTVGCSFSQNKDFKYFDKNWQETIKDKAFFYRIMPSKKIDNLVLIEDFYINKTPQFQGYSLESDENSHVGDIVWYDENGFDSSVYQYYNVSAPVLTYYYPNGKKLRTVEYKKGKKDGFTILYHQDGTVLMKGKYLEGKPVEGDFEDISTWDDYRRNESEVETDSTIDADPVVVSSVEVITKDSPVEVTTMPKKKTAKKIVKQKIFWINSKQVAQEKWYDPENYRMYPYKQMNYDVNGKLLQSIDKSGFEEYGNRISNGIFYCYYLQNKFAVAIK
ncbi:hypothetical protein SGQ44_01320 [Flavobacterium sp. Fl-77]|uniref:MORN repeat variant n=1 Tax=Flavobacterium flavipigmentatum TaxID=2893884 RepID=A0AAJ2VZV0_9FLAO|nr:MULTISPECIES: hypothetical protein [unclassified Flavobacterium]MDX6180775.1 hypothetical protein [Flavobacterium sp. Fl-33]MDX6184375.1 hypothetical protein [Flavobacterium sp. Fl-77]UFH39484.1 hypothetical protein LNP22_04215 [Flavobacterium sp. F-70]